MLNRLAVNTDIARTGRHQAHDHVKRGGLARTIGAQQAHHFAGTHRHVHIVHHRAGTVAFAQALSVKTGRGGVAVGGGERIAHVLNARLARLHWGRRCEA